RLPVPPSLRLPVLSFLLQKLLDSPPGMNILRASKVRAGVLSQRRTTEMHSRINPLIYVRNKAQKKINDEEIKRMVAAVQRQVTEDFQPVWGTGAQLVFAERKEDVPVHAYQIVVYETAKDAEDKD